MYNPIEHTIFPLRTSADPPLPSSFSLSIINGISGLHTTFSKSLKHYKTTVIIWHLRSEYLAMHAYGQVLLYVSRSDGNKYCVHFYYLYGNIRTHFTLQYDRVFYFIVFGIHQLRSCIHSMRQRKCCNWKCTIVSYNCEIYSN